MELAYGYVEYAENSSHTSDTDEEENHNTWNALLEALTMPGSSPAIQQSLQDWEVCRLALSCHFALDILYSGKQDSDCLAAQKTRYARLCVPVSRCGKQGSDCHTPSLTARNVRASCYGKSAVRKKACGRCQGGTKPDCVQAHPGRGHSIA